MMLTQPTKAVSIQILGTVFLLYFHIFVKTNKRSFRKSIRVGKTKTNKNMKKNLLAIVITLGMFSIANGQKLDKFGADLGKKSVMGKEIRVPYTDLTSYFGYIKPGSKPDEVKGGKKCITFMFGFL